jgi:hypothetical protein
MFCFIFLHSKSSEIDESHFNIPNYIKDNMEYNDIVIVSIY